MNFVFDIGNVLVDFKPDVFLHRLYHDPVIEEKLNDIVFRSGEWLDLDRGTVTPEAACDIFCAREPEYRALICETMVRIPEMLTPIMATARLLPEIKAAGHGLYYLSNYHTELSRYILAKYPFFNSFDGGVFSCDIHVNKPNPEIYRYFLSRYGLKPNDCLFFDDVEENVRAANSAGMRGVLFEGARTVEKYIRG